jgi:hypothetical protein
MAVYFFDSSAIVKNYISEVGSTWLRGIINAVPSHELYISRLANVEVIAAITRRARGGSVTAIDATNFVAQFKQHLVTDFRVLEVSLPLILQAVALTENHGLRGYDALQLASALTINHRLLSLGLTTLSFTFVSADDELNSAAQTEGLVVDNPNSHP